MNRTGKSQKVKMDGSFSKDPNQTQNLSKLLARVNSPNPTEKGRKETDDDLDVINEQNRKFVNMPL